MKKTLLTLITVLTVFQLADAQWTNISGTGNYYLNSGNVGIGTTTPAHLLHIQGNVGSNTMLQLFTTDTLDGRSSILFGSNKGLQNWEFGENIAGSTGLFGLRDLTRTGHPIVFVANTAGNIGFGTTNPGAGLEVNILNGSNQAKGILSARYGGSVYTGGSLYAGYYTGGTEASPAAPVVNTLVNSFAFYTGGTNGTIFVNPSFSIQHTLTSIYAGMSNVNTSFMVNSTASGAPVAALTLQGQTASGTVGYVGIGTTSPWARLSVDLNTALNNYPVAQFFNSQIVNGQSTYFTLGQSISTNNSFIFEYDHNNTSSTRKLQIYAYESGGNQFTLLANGSIGIGTGNPGAYMLAVKGNVHVQQVNVDLTGWSDYVFNKNYHLSSLTEVKTYIDQNHHLPEIPSEQEIAKDGLNLGEMNKLLVKKVEELTLYLIELNKQVKEQQKEIEQLIKTK